MYGVVLGIYIYVLSHCPPLAFFDQKPYLNMQQQNFSLTATAAVRHIIHRYWQSGLHPLLNVEEQ